MKKSTKYLNVVNSIISLLILYFVIWSIITEDERRLEEKEFHLLIYENGCRTSLNSKGIPYSEKEWKADSLRFEKLYSK